MFFGNTGLRGERYLETKDLNVGPMSVVQFDVSIILREFYLQTIDG